MLSGSGGGSDHTLARSLAHETAELLKALLDEGSARSHGAPIEHLGDRKAHEFLVGELARHRPDDAVLSEEGHDDPARLVAERVWIVDPLDGSSDFGWSGAWSVHVALCRNGRPVAGAVAVPAWGTTFSSHPPAQPSMCRVGPRRIVVARSRRHSDGRRLQQATGAEIVTVGSAGVKAMAVVRGEVDAYVHGGGMYEWDSCAPVAVALAAGLHASRLDGSALRYNRPDPWAPGLVICRRSFADEVLAAVA